MPALTHALTHQQVIGFAAFLASFVECVEALTVILAVGTTRGWRSALAGTATALLTLSLLIVLLGSALTRIPLARLQLATGILLLLFGLRWLRKAILRYSGHIAMHDEQAAYAKNSATLRDSDTSKLYGWDTLALGTAFNITMLEGVEVVFIVLAIAAGGPGLLAPASLGALIALAIVTLLGLLLHRPLARIPENLLKCIVGILLSSFGTFWTGEGLNAIWPGDDLSILGLVAGYTLTALLAIAAARRVATQRAFGHKRVTL
jgi:uncharacterized membrane protein